MAALVPPNSVTSSAPPLTVAMTLESFTMPGTIVPTPLMNALLVIVPPVPPFTMSEPPIIEIEPLLEKLVPLLSTMFNVAPLLASAGIAGVALAFGAQNLIKDFLAGIFMTLEDQYGVGDIVDVTG